MRRYIKGPTAKTDTLMRIQTVLSNGANNPEPVADSPGLLARMVYWISSKAVLYEMSFWNSGKIGKNATTTSTSCENE